MARQARRSAADERTPPSGAALPARPARALLLFAVLALASVAGLLDRTWRAGEVFSPADLLEIYYPWAHDRPRHEPANPTRSDEAFYHQPLMMTHWARLKRGDFPEWDPLVLSGVAAFNQGLNTGQAFSPLSLPFYVAPPDIAVTLYAPLRLLLAALFMWLYLRHAGLGPAACAAGGLAYGLNGAFVAWLSAPMPTVALFLPLMLLYAERVAQSARTGDVLGLAAVSALQLAGAYLPTSLVVMATTAGWGLFHAAVLPAHGAPGTAPGAARSRRLRAAAGLIAALGLSLALGAAALWPMLESLIGSPAAARAVSRHTLPWHNLATFAVPDLWGSPVARTWWYPGEPSYPEVVTYLGVGPWALAAVALALAPACQRRRIWAAALTGAWVLCAMYGWPPASWLAGLPGLAQTNPFRWNAALALALAVLAAVGVEAAEVSARRGRTWRPVAAAAVVLAALAGLAGLVLLQHLDTVRRLSLQHFERAQLARFAILACAALAATAWLARRLPGWRCAAWLFPILIAADLVAAGRGFNPTLPRDRLYPDAPALAFLRSRAAAGRLVPVGPGDRLVQGHVWGVYGLEAVTGYDFRGDPIYQALMARAAGVEPGPTRWDYVGLSGAAPPDLKLLGLVNGRFLVTPPLDVETRGSGYTTVGELGDGRIVRQEFTAGADGLRRIDLLAATFGRTNRGQIELRVISTRDGRMCASRRLAASEVRDLDWLRIDFPEERGSRGARYAVEIRGEGAQPGQAVTLLATAGGGLAGGRLTIDGQADPRALWIRTFATARDRIAGARAIYTRDLNVYENPLARPWAWFVEAVEVLPAAAHPARLAAPEVDPARTALLDAPLSGIEAALAAAALRPPRVVRVDRSHPDARTIDVEAPAGGLLVINERFHRGWRLAAGGAGRQPVPLVRADGVLMAAHVPPGTTRLHLEFHSPTLAPSLAVSILAGLGMAVAGIRARRQVRGPSLPFEPPA
jgi:hypothetical protein